MNVAHSVRFVARRGSRPCEISLRIGSDTIVVMAHGLAGDKTSRSRFPRLASHLNDAGIDALAFDFAGCGESDDDLVAMAGLEDDVWSAVRIVAEIGDSRSALYGLALGGLVALRAWSVDVVTVAATGAFTHALAYDWCMTPKSATRSPVRAEDSSGFPKARKSRSSKEPAMPCSREWDHVSAIVTEWMRSHLEEG